MVAPTMIIAGRTWSMRNRFTFTPRAVSRLVRQAVIRGFLAQFHPLRLRLNKRRSVNQSFNVLALAAVLVVAAILAFHKCLGASANAPPDSNSTTFPGYCQA
jgi:hypothetical protein